MLVSLQPNARSTPILITSYRPIHTYSGEAALKPNLPERDQHAITHTSSTAPDPYFYETEDGTILKENLTRDPIRVRCEQTDAEGTWHVLQDQ
jgi:hypothetical protein